MFGPILVAAPKHDDPTALRNIRAVARI